MSSPYSPSLSASTASVLLSAAEKAAAARGIACSISIVDGSGQLCAFLRMDGAALAGIKLSLSKARCSVAVGGHSTAALAGQLASDPALVVGLAVGGGLTLLPGGEPLHRDGVLLGAIGVSGVAADSDVAIATDALVATTT
ncbi:heme-binding protein [Amycolatopsis sp. GM8]|uniref:GlcG/HbpS family heme-binding protein n=1 Tax=Amycolatopsis sp. GM8 TaxID=2896530 RepID=UPI001F48F662|nr:heme-binding protein [Amycolatopsis sp. GM8]